MSLLRYSEYRDSAVEWIGEVPAHWEDKPLITVAACNELTWPDDTPPDTEIEYVEISDVDADRGITQTTAITFEHAPSRARRKTRARDVILSTVRTYLRAIAQIPKDASGITVSTGFAVFSARGISADFMMWALKADFFVESIISRSVGVSYPAINASQIGKLKIPVPFPAEQRAIAAFLDRECGKIDALIAEQERLIALLEEKRQAVISHAVTKGLDPNAPMKDSGIPWIGMVPEGWRVKKTRFVAHLNPSRKEIGEVDVDTDLPFFPMEAIGEDGSLDFSFTKSLKEALSGYSYFRNNDIAIAKVTPCFENGKGAVFFGLENGFGFGTTELTIVRCLPSMIIASYLELWFKTPFFRRLGVSAMTGAGGLKRVADDFVKDFYIALPSIAEQEKILTHTRDLCGVIGEIVQEKQRLLELLRERRAALISAAVTGKIDVRGLVDLREAA